MTARERFLARYTADPAAAIDLAETALGICLRHVKDPSSVDLTDDEQERLYELLLAMLATDDARDESARERFMARYAADPAAAREVAEIALGICLRHVADPSSVDLTDDEQERLYELLLAMLATADARDESADAVAVRGIVERTKVAPIPPDVQERLDRGVAELLAQVPGRTNAIAGTGQYSHHVPTVANLVVEMRDGNHEGTEIWLGQSGLYYFRRLDRGDSTELATRCVLIRGQDVEMLSQPYGCDLDSPDGLCLVGVECDDELEWISEGAEVLWDSRADSPTAE